MTDLKTANEQLAQALKALESPEHDADVREAEACRNRLMELDERIGARIKAKLEAHKAIADAWGKQEPDSRFPQLRPVSEAVSMVWAENLTKALKTETPMADAWQAHHEEHTGKYALSGEEVPDRVMVNGVAEMQQAVTDDA